MDKTFLDAVKKRRSYYSLSNQSPVSDRQIQDILETAVKHAPSSYNCQSARVMLLRADSHLALWDIVMETLRAIVPEKSFDRTERKINAFAAAYATVLFFEDQNVIDDIQKKVPAFADNFPVWSEQASGMLQYIVWTALENEGFGASLQHYNPIIDDQVRLRFQVPSGWRLIAQMPFGLPVEEPGEKTFAPLSERLIIR